MIFITILFVILFVLYNWIMYTVYGELWSVSAGYYELEPDEENKGNKERLGWIFTLFVLCIAGYLIAVTIMTEHVLFFIAVVGAIFTGVASRFKEKTAKWLHYGGSALMVLGSATGCWVVFGNWYVLVLISILITTSILYIQQSKGKLSNPLYWSEITTFIYVVFGITLGLTL